MTNCVMQKKSQDEHYLCINDLRDLNTLFNHLILLNSSTSPKRSILSSMTTTSRKTIN